MPRRDAISLVTTATHARRGRIGKLCALPRDDGLSLVECMIVVAIVGVLITTGLPSFTRMLSYSRASSVTNDLVHAIALARSEALKRTRRVYLAPLRLHWRNGWAVFVDRNDNRLFDPYVDDVIFQHDVLAPSIAISNAPNPTREPFTDVGTPQRTYIMFDGTGYARQRNGAFNAGSFTITDRSGSVTTVRTICLSAYGRVRVVIDHAGCS